MIPAMKTLSFLIGVIIVSSSFAVTARQHQPGKPDHAKITGSDPEYAKSFDDPARDGWQLPDRVTIGTLKLSPDASVADVGAGTGVLQRAARRSVPRGTVYAVDIRPSMLDHSEARGRCRSQNVVTVQASGTSANLRKPVDVVLIVDTYHHIPTRAT